MTDLKVGDRVKVEFEDTITYIGLNLVTLINTGAVVPKTALTKLGPTLPTASGSVIRSHGYTFTLTTRGWLAHTDKTPYTPEGLANSMYGRDFTVLFDAGNPEGGK